MINKLARRCDDFMKLAAEKQTQHVYKNRQAGDKVKTEKTDEYSQSMDCEVKFDD